VDIVHEEEGREEGGKEGRIEGIIQREKKTELFGGKAENGRKKFLDHTYSVRAI